MFVGYSSFYFVYCSCFNRETDIVGAWNYLASVEYYQEQLAKFKDFQLTGRNFHPYYKTGPLAPVLPCYWDSGARPAYMGA